MKQHILKKLLGKDKTEKTKLSNFLARTSQKDYNNLIIGYTDKYKKKSSDYKNLSQFSYNPTSTLNKKANNNNSSIHNTSIPKTKCQRDTSLNKGESKYLPVVEEMEKPISEDRRRVDVPKMANGMNYSIERNTQNINNRNTSHKKTQYNRIFNFFTSNNISPDHSNFNTNKQLVFNKSTENESNHLCMTTGRSKDKSPEINLISINKIKRVKNLIDTSFINNTVKNKISYTNASPTPCKNTDSRKEENKMTSNIKLKNTEEKKSVEGYGNKIRKQLVNDININRISSIDSKPKKADNQIENEKEISKAIDYKKRIINKFMTENKVNKEKSNERGNNEKKIDNKDNKLMNGRDKQLVNKYIDLKGRKNQKSIDLDRIHHTENKRGNKGVKKELKSSEKYGYNKIVSDELESNNRKTTQEIESPKRNYLTNLDKYIGMKIIEKKNIKITEEKSNSINRTNIQEENIIPLNVGKALDNELKEKTENNTIINQLDERKQEFFSEDYYVEEKECPILITDKKEEESNPKDEIIQETFPNNSINRKEIDSSIRNIEKDSSKISNEDTNIIILNNDIINIPDSSSKLLFQSGINETSSNENISQYHLLTQPNNEEIIKNQFHSNTDKLEDVIELNLNKEDKSSSSLKEKQLNCLKEESNNIKLEVENNDLLEVKYISINEISERNKEEKEEIFPYYKPSDNKGNPTEINQPLLYFNERNTREKSDDHETTNIIHDNSSNINNEEGNIIDKNRERREKLSRFDQQFNRLRASMRVKKSIKENDIQPEEPKIEMKSKIQGLQAHFMKQTTINNTLNIAALLNPKNVPQDNVSIEDSVQKSLISRDDDFDQIVLNKPLRKHTITKKKRPDF